MWDCELLQNEQILPNPDSKVHGANMGSIWGRQDPGGPHAGPVNFSIWELILSFNLQHPVRFQLTV